MRAYRKARAWLIATPAAEVAKAEASFFKDIDQPVLTQTIATYQKLGNWTPHVEITKPAFEATRRHLPARRADHQAPRLRGHRGRRRRREA